MTGAARAADGAHRRTSTSPRSTAGCTSRTWCPPTAVDDDLAGLLHEELFGPGWLRGTDLFERVFTGVVRTSAEDALDSWELFYRNTMRRLEAPGRRGCRCRRPRLDRRLRARCTTTCWSCSAPGSVLELGCCFGFLALRIARSGRATTASDVSAGTVQLLTAIAPRLGVDLATETADAARYPASDGCADTVLAVHLLEHLEPGARHPGRGRGATPRRARGWWSPYPWRTRRTRPTATSGRSPSTTCTAGDAAPGCAYDVHEFHGGWLVVDKP